MDYCRAPLSEDPHLSAMTLLDQVSALGYGRRYLAFTRRPRARGLGPACEPCSPVKGRPAVIDHPPGEETLFDWAELPDPTRRLGRGRLRE